MNNMNFFKTACLVVALVIFHIITTKTSVFSGDSAELKKTIQYSWQISDAEASHIYENIKLLRYGDELSEVKKSIGSPAVDQDLFSKKGVFFAHELRYAIKRVRPEGGNVMDQEISLSFDRQGRLFRISYNAMQPLSGEVILSGTEPQSGTVFYITKPPMPTEPE